MRRSPLPARVALAALVVAATACGAEDIDGSEATVVEEGELVPMNSLVPTTLAKPTVQVPAEAPTELVVTELVAGAGRKAAEGDTVIVDYVGVRVADGAEFDNSYDRGVPFDVKLGRGGVIPGWEQGLLDAQAGARRQLDIPASLAYGDNPPAGSGIQPGDALTFVIDVRAIVPPVDASAAPVDLEVPTSVDAEAVTFDDVAAGDGAALAAGQTAIVQLLLRRGDDGTLLYSTWDAGEPLPFAMTEESWLPGLVDGLAGMRVGGRRIITIPADEAFGPSGHPELGLPAGVDLVVVADLVTSY